MVLHVMRHHVVRQHAEQAGDALAMVQRLRQGGRRNEMETFSQRTPVARYVSVSVQPGRRRGVDRRHRAACKPSEHGVSHGRSHRAERQRVGRITVLPGPATAVLGRLIPQLPAKVVWVVHHVLQTIHPPNQGLPWFVSPRNARHKRLARTAHVA